MAHLKIYGEYASIDDGGEVDAEIIIDDSIVAKMKADQEEGEILDIYFIRRKYRHIFSDMEDAIRDAAFEVNDDVQEFCVYNTNIEEIIKNMDKEK